MIHARTLRRPACGARLDVGTVCGMNTSPQLYFSSYEANGFKDISHYALIRLVKSYEVSVDYLLVRSQTKSHPNAELADLGLSDDMIELLKSGLVIHSLLCELAAHPDFA